MAKALAIGASIAAIAAVTVVTGGAALGLGVSLGTSIIGTGISASALLATSAVLSAGSSLLAPKPKAPAGLSQADRLTVSINVREPRKIVFGSTAMATDLRDQEWTSDQTYLHRFIVLASHRINAVREIWFDDKLAWTAAGGAQGEFAKWLQVTPVLEGSAANAINVGPRMGGARRFTGCAYVHLRYQILAHSKKLDSVFNQSVPSRVTIVGDGASVYDPRRDSTVPGGSGPQRANDQSTWEWNASASRNPALCTLFYLLGWRINGKLAVGKGIPSARIDLPSFIEAANLCDEPVARAAGGTEPRYRCDGVVSEGDDTSAVLENLKATMNAVLDDVDGRLRVSVLHNDLAAPIGDLFTGDVLGAFNWQQTLPLNDSVSVIRGGYTDPSASSLYQTADYPEVMIASRDGIERSQTVNYPLVQSASQAQRLSKQRLQRMLYGGTFSAVFQSTAWKFQKGDVIRLSFAPLGWSRKLFRIADMATQVDGKVPMMLREEHPAIYAWDASDAAPVTGVEPTRYDPALWPLVQGITEAGTTAEWDKVADPGNTKPEDNATVGAPEGTNIGGRPVTDVLAAFDAAQAQQNHFETVTIPAVEQAVADAGERITAAKGRADDAYDRAGQAIEDAETVNRRVDTLIAEGGGGSDGVDSVARAEIKRVDEAAIGRDDAVARSVETLSASYTAGGNLLSNTDFALDTAGWTFASESESRGYRNQFSPDIYWPAGTAALITYQPNVSPARAGLWYQPVYGLEGGASYQVSAYVASHRATAGIYIDQFRADGAIVGHSEVASAKFNTGTRNLSADYERLVVNFVAHPDASYLILYMIKYGTVPGADPADSYSWFLRPQVVKVRAGVTAAVPYMPGSGDAGRIATDARVSREVVALAEADAALARESFAIEARMSERVSASARDVTTAFTEADRALGSRATTLEASASAARSSVNPNPEFSAWSNPATTPDRWAYWNVIDPVERIENPLNRGGFAVQQTPTDENSGIVVGGIFVSLGRYFMEVMARKVSGSWAGAGITLNGQVSINFMTVPDTAGRVGDVADEIRSWSYPIEVTDAPAGIGAGFKNWHCMSNWGAYGYGFVGKQIWWLECRLRRASEAEGALPGVAARVKTTEDTLADLPNRFASAQRTIDLEAQVNGETGSRLLSRATEQATVIADAKAGVVAQSVETLRTEYNGRIGVVEQQAGSITGIDGRTEVYWRVTGTTNDGATQISLTKKDGSSPLFYIGANTLIDGNLMVTGTVTTRVIQNGSITNSVTTTGGSYQFAQNTRQQTGEAYLQPSGTGFVRIDVRLSTNYVDGESGVTAPNKWLLQLYRDQDGQTRFVGSTEFREGPYIPFLDIDVPTSTSLCRYYVVCTLTVAQRTGFVFNTKIIATESKK